MDFSKTKHSLSGLHQFLIQSNWQAGSEASTPTKLAQAIQTQGFEEIFLLLHGYSEDGTKIFRRLGRHLVEKFENENKKVAILAPNGLYPMPRAFPLSQEIKSTQDLLQGFAWYFYHAGSNTFIIDYKVPSQTLGAWLGQINPNNLPVTIVGYSQGGYLAPFVAMDYSHHGNLKKVLGINCSFREDLMKETPNFPMELVQGKQDEIIDTQLAHERFQKLKGRGLQGDYHWVETADHKLTMDVAQKVVSLC